MSARLFRRLKSSFSRFNKTFFFSIALGLVVVFFSVSHALADATADKATLDLQYNDYISLFNGASGIEQTGLQNSAANGEAIGITFRINLDVIPPAGVSLESRWAEVADLQQNTFVIKLCSVSDTSHCWLSSVPYTQADPASTQNIIARKSSQGGYSDSQTINISAFSLDSGITTAASSTTTYVTSAPGATSYQSNISASKNGGNLYVLTTSTDGTTTTQPLASALQIKGSTVVASLWYCAAGSGADAAGVYKSKGVSTATIGTFGSLCQGKTYFQIGTQTNSFLIPTDAATTQQQVAAGQAALATAAKRTSSEDGNLPTCGITSGTKLYGCVAYLAYGIYVLVAWIAGILGNMFDFFIGYSVSDASYRYPFAVNGWKLVRDISNIFFIIIMVYTGFSAVFDPGKVGAMKKIVPTLIINALLINFSLFATRVVIDLSNITARMFYSQMVVCDKINIDDKGKCDPAQAKRGPGGYWPLSEKILSSFNPQQLFKTATLQPTTAPSGNVSTSSTQPGFVPGATADTSSTTEIDYINYFMVVCLVAAIIIGFAGIIFFKIGFMFVARVVGLYVCMIFSPFAFLSQDIPFFGKVSILKWSDWSSDLSSYALSAPVFTFFLYVIFTIISSDFVQQIGYVDPTGSFMGTVLGIVIPMALIYFLLDTAYKTTSKLSGTVGNYVQALGQQATSLAAGTALGIASGGVSLAGTSAARFFRASDETRSKLEATKAGGGFAGRVAEARLSAANWTQKQSFDARNTSGVKKISNLMGINGNNKMLSTLGFGSERTKGGRDGQLKRAEDDTKKDINSVATYFSKDEDAVAFWEKHLQSEKMQKQLTRQAQDAYKKKFGKNATEAEMASDEFKKLKTEAVEGFGKVKNNKQLTNALRVQYADTLLNEQTVGLSIDEGAVRAGAYGAGASLLGAGAGTMLAPVGALALGAFTENTGKHKAARAFLDAQRKASSDEKKKSEDKEKKIKDITDKTKQEETLEKDKSAIEKELKAIDEKLGKIYEVEAKKTVAAKPGNAGKSATEIKEQVDAEMARLTERENRVEATRVVNEHRQNLKNRYDEADMDVRRADKDLDDAIKSGDKVAIKNKERARSAKVAKRNKIDAEYTEIDPIKRKSKQDEYDRKEADLIRIKEAKEFKKERYEKDLETKDRLAAEKAAKEAEKAAPKPEEKPKA